MGESLVMVFQNIPFSDKENKTKEAWLSEQFFATQQENPLDMADQMKHPYRLTVPELSPAQEIAQRRKTSGLGSDENFPYQLSNIPYLLLVTIIFLVNGLILFFGPAIREIFLTSASSDNANLSASSWASSDILWPEEDFLSNHLDAFMGSSTFFASPPTVINSSDQVNDNHSTVEETTTTHLFR